MTGIHKLSPKGGPIGAWRGGCMLLQSPLEPGYCPAGDCGSVLAGLALSVTDSMR